MQVPCSQDMASETETDKTRYTLNLWKSNVPLSRACVRVCLCHLFSHIYYTQALFSVLFLHHFFLCHCQQTTIYKFLSLPANSTSGFCIWHPSMHTTPHATPILNFLPPEPQSLSTHSFCWPTSYLGCMTSEAEASSFLLELACKCCFPINTWMLSYLICTVFFSNKIDMVEGFL